MWHIDPWPSRHSEILYTGRICEKKRKKSRGWMETCGCYEMIYTDAHVRYRQCKCEFWVSLSFQSRELGTPLETRAHSGPPVECPQLRSKRRAKWALKITQRGMVKRRSYGSKWQSVFVSLPSFVLSLSLAVCLSVLPQKLWLQEE